MTFDPTKPVQTRSGLPARVLATDLHGDEPIAAAIRHEEDESVHSFFENGRLLSQGEHAFDLLNVDAFAKPGREIVARRDGGRAWVVTREGPMKDYPLVGFLEGWSHTESWTNDGRVVSGESNGWDLILSEVA